MVFCYIMCVCLLIRRGAQTNMGTHPVHRLPQQAPSSQQCSAAPGVLVRWLVGHLGQQKAVRNSWTCKQQLGFLVTAEGGGHCQDTNMITTTLPAAVFTDKKIRLKHQREHNQPNGQFQEICRGQLFNTKHSKLGEDIHFFDHKGALWDWEWNRV